MSQATHVAPEAAPDPGFVTPDVSALVTEDDTPVDNIYSERQQRLLTRPLLSSWSGPPADERGDPRPFAVMANVGLFSSVHEPPVVPDVLLSLDVAVPRSVHAKRHRSYFVWEYGKPPDVVVEVVSNREGEELGRKRARYARLHVSFYVVWDPARWLGEATLHAFELRGDLFVPVEQPVFPSMGLLLRPWTGEFEGIEAEWLRWHLLDGTAVPLGAERAEAERERAEAAHARAERLAARLRALGEDPDVEP